MELEPIRFRIPGPPVGKQRPRFLKGEIYTPSKTVKYERHVRSCGQVALLTRPDWNRVVPSKRWFVLTILIGHRTERFPDADNIIKSIEDGLEGVFWENDRTVIPRVSDVIIGYADPQVDVEIRFRDK